VAFCLLQENISTPEPADISEDDHYPSKHSTFHYLRLPPPLSLSLSLSLFLSPTFSLFMAQTLPFLAGVEGGRTFSRLRITRA